MDYKILNTPYYKPAVNLTEVQIYCNLPYTIITRDVIGDQSKEDESKLIKAVLDQVASEYDPTNKLTKLDQSVIKIQELTQQLEESSRARENEFNNMKSEFERIKKSLEETQKTLASNALADIPDTLPTV